MKISLERIFSTRSLVAVCVVALAVTLLLHTLFAAELKALFDPLVLARESKSQNIYVTRNGPLTMLKSGGLFLNNNAYNPERPLKHYLEYTELLSMAAAFCENPREILVIGLAGGAVPMYLQHHYPEARITCVDFDEAMHDVAIEFFGFEDKGNMTVAIQDGRVFLRQSEKRYDLIVVDAFDGMNVPFHMATREFLELARESMSEGGVLAVNTPSAPGLVERYLATYLSVFPYVDVFAARRARNRILIAHADGEPLSKAGMEELFRRRENEVGFAEIDLPALFRSSYEMTATRAPEGVEPFTDDFAPVNMMIPPLRLAL